MPLDTIPRSSAASVILVAFAAMAAACGDDEPANGSATAQATATSGSAASGSGAQGGEPASGVGASGGGPTGTGGASSGGATSSGGAGRGGGAPEVADPDLDGPYAFAELDATTTVAATGHAVPIHCAYPTAGPDAGPYPVIVVAHGFQLPASQYDEYLRRLATFGYVALTADFPAGPFSVNNVDNAQDLSGALDWAATAVPLDGIADADTAGMSGHSMGGKLVLLAAKSDARVKAVITLDAVDGSMGCNAADCPDVSDLMPLDVPTAFLGETTDSAGGFQPCAPAADNFQTFYAGTTAPSLEVTVAGANHMSFLDDAASCGLVCSFCQPASAPNAKVVSLSKAYLVAFYERYLRGNAGYDTYLTGAAAKARYVDTGLATIESK